MYGVVRLCFALYYELDARVMFLFLFIGFVYGILLLVRLMVVNAYEPAPDNSYGMAYIKDAVMSLRLIGLRIRSRVSLKRASRNARGAPSPQYKSA